jgi:hypothetical protein
MQPDNSISDDPARIEADLARDRADLAGSVNALRHAITSDRLLDEVTGFAKAKLAPLTQTVDSAVRANPIAAAMAAAGVAWLIFGRRSARDSYDDTLQHAIGRWEDEGGPLAPEDDIWVREADSLHRRATTALADLDRAARAQLRPAADLARERAAVVADMAANTRQAMTRGLETLSTAAREQIIAARERAYQARIAVSRAGTALVDDHPFVVGAIALAAGAALAKSIPVTEAEHRILGPERDRLFAEAHHLLQEERARLVGETRAA